MKKSIFLLFVKVLNSLSGKGVERFLVIPGVFSICKSIYRLVKPKGTILINIQGNKMYTNGGDEGVAPILLMAGCYEKYETKLFKNLIRPEMVVLDIGAHIGYYSLIAAKLVGTGGKVYVFEPEPNNYGFLVENIKINDYSNIIPTQKAISNKTETIKLFTDKVNLGNPSLSESNVSEKDGFVEIKTITLDKFFENSAKNSNINFIKMDAQGAEGLIIEGAEKILKNKDLKIIMEFWPYGIKNTGADPFNTLNKLQNYGFKIKLIDEINQCTRHIEIIKIIEMCENAEHSKDFVNLLLEK